MYLIESLLHVEVLVDAVLEVCLCGLGLGLRLAQLGLLLVLDVLELEQLEARLQLLVVALQVAQLLVLAHDVVALRQALELNNC